MEMKDSVSYNSMIDGHVKGGNIELAREPFDSMLIIPWVMDMFCLMLNGYA